MAVNGIRAEPFSFYSFTVQGCVCVVCGFCGTRNDDIKKKKKKMLDIWSRRGGLLGGGQEGARGRQALIKRLQGWGSVWGSWRKYISVLLSFLLPFLMGGHAKPYLTVGQFSKKMVL